MVRISEFHFLVSVGNNIAALNLVSSKVGSEKMMLLTGHLYSMERTLSCMLRGFFLCCGILGVPDLSHQLRKYMGLNMDHCG